VGTLVLGTVLVPASMASGQAPSKQAPGVKIGKLLATLADPGATADDGFGEVALAGNTAVVGADGVDSSAGAAYIYEKGTSGWPTRPTVTLDDPGGTADSYFGDAVAISGSTVAVSATGTSTVYLYDKGTSGWPTRPSVTLDNPSVDTDYFGAALAISGSTLIVGDDEPETTATLEVYLYVKTTSWPTEPTTTLDDPAAEFDDGFGYSVAVSGTTAFVGSPSVGGEGVTYVYVKGGSGWSKTPAVTLDDPAAAASDEFGYSVVISGTTALVGDPSTGSDIGAVYVYTRGASSWPATPTATLGGPTSDPDDFFGSAVGLAGSLAVIGGFSYKTDMGSAFIYKKGASSWPTTPTATLVNPAAATKDYYGESVALAGSTALVGAAGTDSSAGAAYLYKA
jgi:hypothetical protein